MKIGVMFGNPETTPGGRALKFYASVRIDLRKTASITEGGKNLGNRVRARIVKNKVAPPFREAEFEIMFDEGISSVGALIDAAVNGGVIEKSGSWFSFGGRKLGQGKEAVKKVFGENPSLKQEIEIKTRRKLFPDIEGGQNHAGSQENHG